MPNKNENEFVEEDPSAQQKNNQEQNSSSPVQEVESGEWQIQNSNENLQLSGRKKQFKQGEQYCRRLTFWCIFVILMITLLYFMLLNLFFLAQSNQRNQQEDKQKRSQQLKQKINPDLAEKKNIQQIQTKKQKSRQQVYNRNIIMNPNIQNYYSTSNQNEVWIGKIQMLRNKKWNSFSKNTFGQNFQQQSVKQSFFNLFNDFSIKYSFQILKKLQQNQKYKMFGLNQNSQINTPFDFLDTPNREQFSLFKQKYLDSIPHKIYSFDFSQYLEKPFKKNINTFVIENTAQRALRVHASQNNIPSFYSPDFTLGLLWSLAGSIEQGNKVNQYEVSRLEYFYDDSKYQIGKSKTEQPICIVSYFKNIAEQQQNIQFFESLSNQNYSNYQLILIDDNSNDNSLQYIYDYLSKSELKLKNRINFLKLNVEVGKVGSLYYSANKFCGDEDIVVNLPLQGKLIGTQALQVINTVYQKGHTNFTYSKFIQKERERYQQGKSGIIHSSSSEYRSQPEKWVTSYLQTFRQNLIKKVPFQQLIQYKFNQKTLLYQPSFLVDEKSLTYSLIQLCGKEGVFYIDKVLFLSKQNKVKCDKFKEQLKSYIRRPIQLSDSSKDDQLKEKQIAQQNLPESLIDYINEHIYQKNSKCQQQDQETNSLIFSNQQKIAQYLIKNLNCTQIKVIVPSQKIHKYLNKQNITAITVQELQKITQNLQPKQQKSQCGLVQIFNLKLSMFNSAAFDYLLINANNKQNFSTEINDYIKNQKLENTVSLQMHRIDQNEYLVLKFLKHK